MTDDPAATGRDLARFHETTDVDGLPEHFLHAYANNLRHGDWSLRSALVRFAQPHPTVASAVLTLVRRLDAALAPHAKRLERDAVAARPGLGTDDTDRVVADSRAADLARLAARRPDDFDAVLDAYRAEVDLDDETIEAIRLLRIAVGFDDLCELVTAWAARMDGPAPTDEVEARCRALYAELEAAGVPKEEIPEEYRRRRGGASA